MTPVLAATKGDNPNPPTNVGVHLFFLHLQSRYMQPEGPWQRLQLHRSVLCVVSAAGWVSCIHATPVVHATPFVHDHLCVVSAAGWVNCIHATSFVHISLAVTSQAIHLHPNMPTE